MNDTIIHKYPLLEGDELAVTLPFEAVILHVGEQYGGLIMWVQVPTWPTRSAVRRVTAVGTGQPMSIDRLGRYISTVQMPNGLVWHVFEKFDSPIKGAKS